MSPRISAMIFRLSKVLFRETDAGRYPMWSQKLVIFSLNSWLTPGAPERARETEAVDIFSSRAMSVMVYFFLFINLLLMHIYYENIIHGNVS